LQGYQLKGSAIYSADASLVAEGNVISSAYKLTIKGAFIIRVQEIIVLTPGPENGVILQSTRHLLENKQVRSYTLG
jgi:hypothetical protein